MKDFVVGNPYTTETELTDEDTFIILACDGVSFYLNPCARLIYNTDSCYSTSSGMSAMIKML